MAEKNEVVIDNNTGEVLSDKTILNNWRKSKGVRFTMTNMDRGLSWLLKLNGKELACMHWLVDMNDDDGLCRVNKNYLAKLLQLQLNHLSTLLKKLTTEGFITKDTDGRYMVNPRYIFNGGTKLLPSSIVKFDTIVSSSNSSTSGWGVKED